jgi:site-specific recombinase XerD
MKKDYYQQSMRALQLAGMSERTQQCYTRSVRMLVDFYGKTPDKVTEAELQNYFLHRKNVDKWSAATLRICYSGIKFFFINVLKRKWHTLDLIHAKREQRLPVVLSLAEVWDILNTVGTPQNKAYLTCVYTCGLRLHEALHLQWPISTASVCASMSIAARGPKTAMCPCLKRPLPCCEATGPCTAIPNGSFQDWDTAAKKALRPKNR